MTGKICTAFISDRGDLYLPTTRDSFARNVRGWHLADCTIIDDGEHLLGMAGALRAAWDWAVGQDADYLFAVEEDWLFEGTVDLTELAAILDDQRYLAQVCLKRTPSSPEEYHFGGMYEAHPYNFVQRMEHGRAWLEHQWIYSFNPNLTPRRVLDMGLPVAVEAELTEAMLERGLSFAYYGRFEDQPVIRHIGHQRAPGWRL